MSVRSILMYKTCLAGAVALLSLGGPLTVRAQEQPAAGDNGQGGSMENIFDAAGDMLSGNGNGNQSPQPPAQGNSVQEAPAPSQSGDGGANPLAAAAQQGGAAPAEEDASVQPPGVERTAPQNQAAGQGGGDDPFAEYREQLNRLGNNDNGGGQQQGRVSQNLSQSGQPEQTPQQLESEIRKEAFDAAVNGFLPLRPDEIRRFLEIYDETRQASNTPIYPHPEPDSRVVQVSLEPGDEPPVINTSTGHVTTVTFLDSTGSRWPIASMTWAGNFEIAEPEEEGGSSFKIIPMSDYAYGNISINMVDLSAPVIMTLKAQREKVDVRLDAQLPGQGPNAEPSIINRPNSGPKVKAGSVVMTSFLDGTLPEDAEAMQVSGGDGRTKAYRYGGKIYLRTPLSLISPAWDASSRSADGMNIYVLNDTPVLLLSDEGSIKRVFLNAQNDDNTSS